MHKKSFILLSVILFVLFICSGFVCATNEVKNTVNNVTNTIVDGTARLGNDVRNGIGAAQNGIEGALTMDNDNMNDNNNNNNTNANDGTHENGEADEAVFGDYTTTRTTADATTTTDNTSTLWIWLIVAIAAVVIIGLVWYYGTQNRTHTDE